MVVMIWLAVSPVGMVSSWGTNHKRNPILARALGLGPAPQLAPDHRLDLAAALALGPSPGHGWHLHRIAPARGSEHNKDQDYDQDHGDDDKDEYDPPPPVERLDFGIACNEHARCSVT
jgi:hypothetical protein